MDRSMSLRRATGYAFVFILFGLDIYATGLFGGSERTLAVVRSIVLPGLPFLEWHLPLGLATIGLAIASIAAWLRWGVDWLPVLVMSGAVTVAALVMPLHHARPAAGPPHAPGHHEASDVHDAPHAQGNSNARHDAHAHGAALSVPAPSGSGRDASPGWIEASHEFTVVLVVFALVARLSLLLERIPGTTRLQNLLPAGLLFPAVDRARAATLALLAGAREPAIEVLGDPQLLRRATRVNRWARFRSRGDPLSGAHASLRAGLAIAGMLSDARRDALRAEARTSLAGVPVSEPTWVRPLDGMLARFAHRFWRGGWRSDSSSAG